METRDETPVDTDASALSTTETEFVNVRPEGSAVFITLVCG